MFLGDVLNLVDRMEGLYVFLSGKEPAKVSRKRLAISPHVIIGAVPPNVV